MSSPKMKLFGENEPLDKSFISSNKKKSQDNGNEIMFSLNYIF